ncbi:MAG: hypothetical protein Q9162_003932 [Coniocarpon cinnabarinum]
MGSRSLDKANESIKALENEPSIGGRTVIRPVQVDLDSDESIQSAFETVKAEYGKIDILVNNAGIQYEHLWWEGKISQRECWNRDWNTNTAGTHIMYGHRLPEHFFCQPKIWPLRATAALWRSQKTDIQNLGLIPSYRSYSSQKRPAFFSSPVDCRRFKGRFVMRQMFLQIGLPPLAGRRKEEGQPLRIEVLRLA